MAKLGRKGRVIFWIISSCVENTARENELRNRGIKTKGRSSCLPFYTLYYLMASH